MPHLLMLALARLPLPEPIPGPRAVRRRRDFWYSSMSDGAAPSSGRAQHTTETQRIEKPIAAFIPDNGSISDSSGTSSRYRPATFVA